MRNGIVSFNVPQLASLSAVRQYVRFFPTGFVRFGALQDAPRGVFRACMVVFLCFVHAVPSRIMLCR
jgi:hypothetical protein